MNLSRRRRIRKIRYFLGYGLRRFVFCGTEFLYRLVVRSVRQTVYHGFYLADSSINPKDVSIFINATKAALDLIQQNDPRRFRIVQREISTIYQAVLLASFGSYLRQYRQCTVDFSRRTENGISCLDTQDEHYEWHLAGYAAIIVHEATHGRLLSLYFPYNKVTRVRSERICRAEQRRFAARLKSENYDFSQGLIPEFTERDWDFSWNASRWQKIKRIKHRAKEALQQLWKDNSD